MNYKLVIAEKPSVAKSIAKIIGATKRNDGYMEGNGYIVSWCFGHLIELAQPVDYDEKYGKWRKGWATGIQKISFRRTRALRS